ncbi:MAG: prolipoprotein diacylglyceryl transferase [Planctomycetia bacterium]|nr:prolipoprotein diacylglyceryl transferase [Planctomycetia bacterium]
MQQTLFYLPYQLGGFPLFGLGIVLGLWFLAVLLVSLRSWKKSGWNREKTSTLLLSLVVGVVVSWGLPLIGRPAGVPIQGYGLMMLLAILLSGGLVVWRAPRFGFTHDDVFEICLWLCIPGLIGARLFYVIEYWQEIYTPNVAELIFRILNFPAGGLVVYGSFFGAVVGGTYYLWKKRLSMLRMFDLLAPGMMLGLALGRIGCFLNGCCFGGVCDLEHQHWGVSFPAGSPPYERQLENGDIHVDPNAFYYGMRLEQTPDGTQVAEVSPNGESARHGIQAGDQITYLNGTSQPTRDQVLEILIFRVRQEGLIAMECQRKGDTFRTLWTTTRSAGPVSLPVYPTQLYSSGMAFLLCLVLLLHARLRRNPNGLGLKRDGEAISLMLLLYSINRYCLENVRIDEADFLQTGRTVSQNVSILLFLLAAAMMVWIHVRPAKRV